MADQKVSVGRVVHFVLVDKQGATQHRPAIVVRVWPDGDGGPYADEASKGTHVVQLQVFSDGANDGNENVLWMTSVHFDPSGAPRHVALAGAGMICSSKPIDLGHGVTGEIRSVDGEVHGLYYEHACVGGQMSPGWVPVQGPIAWTLVSLEPLTLSPSLLCPLCGHHGFVRDGRWVPA